jgi:hypothetical protein
MVTMFAFVRSPAIWKTLRTKVSRQALFRPVVREAHDAKKTPTAPPPAKQKRGKVTR